MGIQEPDRRIRQKIYEIKINITHTTKRVGIVLIFASPLGSVEQGTVAEESWPWSAPDCGTAAVWGGSDRCSRTDWTGEARSVGTDPGYTLRSDRPALPGRAQS